MNEQKVKKRGWVKNVAIIFLTVLLVLTFFSNTIMNRSLPEVATASVTDGTISPKIRGTGAVSANEKFEVKSETTRGILSVPVKVGDKVSVGDVLVNFADVDGEELKKQQDALDDLVLNYQKALINASSGKYSSDKAAVSDAQASLDAAKAKRNSNAVSDADIANAEANVNNCTSALEKAQRELADYDGETTDSPQYSKLKEAVAAAEQKLEAAKSARDALLAKRSAYNEAGAEVSSCQKTLQNALLTLEKNIALESLDLASMKKDIDAQNKVISDLKAGGDGATVTSKINGIVAEISATAGNTAEAGSTIMVVEVPDRGYQTSFSVTIEQSKKVKKGETAEVLYNYHGKDLTATLAAIKPDPENPGKKKLLVFDLKGEVESGEQLNLSIGEHGQNYEAIVPNSAVRTDNNGSFVLVVTSKSSPLGNRYIAKRIDVQVLASDDKFSAVSGGLTFNDFVITTSSKPIEPGTQVRLAENAG